MCLGKLIVGLIILLLTQLYSIFAGDILRNDSGIEKVILGGAKNTQIIIPQKTIDFLNYINKAVDDPRPTLFYEELHYIYKYDNYNVFKHNCHYGQRKLLLNEIQFFTYHLSADIECIIYVGAAPCEHLTVIQHLFPNQKYLLIDPNYCIIDAPAIYIYQNPEVISQNALRIIDTYDSGKLHQRRGIANLRKMKILGDDNDGYDMLEIEKNRQKMLEIKRNFELNKSNLLNIIKTSEHNIFIIQDYMSIELSRIIANTQIKTLFVSDMRTNLFESGPVDLDILHNDCLQIAILHILQPQYSMLKFHPPYYSKKWEKYFDKLSEPNFAFLLEPIDYVGKLFGVNILDEFKMKRHYNYAETNIYIQPWAPTSSTETRLIISVDAIRNNKFKIYDANEWENKFNVLRYLRMYSYIDKYAAILNISHISHVGYDGCYDCFIELTILYQYIECTDDGDRNRDKTKASRANIQHFMPNKSQQIAKLDKLQQLIKIVNSSLRYDLGKYANSKCKLHSYMKPHKHNYFYVQLSTTQCVCWHNGKIDTDLSLKLNETSNDAEAKLVKKYIDESYIHNKNWYSNST